MMGASLCQIRRQQGLSDVRHELSQQFPEAVHHSHASIPRLMRSFGAATVDLRVSGVPAGTTRDGLILGQTWEITQ